MSDDVLYRAVACAAFPGADCSLPMTAWPAPHRRSLTVALNQEGDEPRNPRNGQVSRALDRALREINAVGADLQLTRVADGTAADIAVWDSNLVEGQALLLPEAGLDGSVVMEGARVEIWWDSKFRINRGVIVIARDLDAADLRSVVLEELVQSLGLVTDITGAAYAATSIFSEDSNAVTRLTGQDAAVIRLHYPKE